MAYELRIDKHAGRTLAKLPNDIAARIFNKLRETKDDPFRHWERLEGRADYKLRIGDYRAIADLNESRRTIEVTKIGHRRNVYEH